MRYFDVRQSGELGRDATWPTEAAGLWLLELPTRLQVPLASKPAPGAVADVPVGSAVTKGQPLTLFSVAGAAAAVALAPTSGRVVGSGRVQLLNGNWAPAVDVEADFEDRAAAGEVHDAVYAQAQHDQIREDTEVIGPEDLATW